MTSEEDLRGQWLAAVVWEATCQLFGGENVFDEWDDRIFEDIYNIHVKKFVGKYGI